MITARPPHNAPLPRLDHPHRDWPFRRSATMRYGVAVLMVATAFLVRYVVYGDIQNRLAFTFFVPAALVAAWYGGVGAGMLATGLGLVVGSYFFLLPRVGMWPPGERELMAIGVYAITTIVCVLLCENLHNRIRKLEHALDDERHHHAHSAHPEAPVPPPDAAVSR